MAMVTRTALGMQTTPEEFTSYQNIAASFPPVFEEGKRLLWEVAGKIQIMRLETEIFPQLTVEGNKEAIKAKEKEYTAIQKQVTDFRATLHSINGQILRAISLCDAVPETDIRSFELTSKSTKVYEFCRQSLPTLHDWSLQGSLLAKRFDLIMTKDYKHYEESIENYQRTINPSTSFLGNLTSRLTSLFSSRPEAAAAEEMAAPVVLDPRMLNVCVCLLAVDNSLLENLPLQSAVRSFITKVAPEESSKYEDYKPQIIFLKVLLSRLNKQESFRNIQSLDAEAALLELQKQVSLALARRMHEKMPASITAIAEQQEIAQVLTKIDSKLPGAKTTAAALRASLQQLIDTQLECYQKPAKDPLKTDLLNQLVILASRLK